MIRRVVVVVAVIALLAAALQYSQRRPSSAIISGFIEADEIRLGSRVGGRVQKVLVVEGERVTAGQLLVELEPFDLRERRAQADAEWSRQAARYEELKSGFREEDLAQARARLAQAEAQLEQLVNGPRPQELQAAQAEVDFAQSELTLAEENRTRTRALKASGSITQEVYDRAERLFDGAAARLRARREQLALLEEGTRAEELAAARARVAEATAARDLLLNGFRPQEIEQAHAAARAAESARDAIDRQIAELQVFAPTSGTVDALELQPGDLVAANAPVVSIVATGRLWVRTYAPENRLNLQVGQSLPVTVDSYPGEVFAGEVSFIARQAEFTPHNVQTPEERSQQVFRIKVLLHEPEGRLRPGMAADVWLEGRP